MVQTKEKAVRNKKPSTRRKSRRKYQEADFMLLAVTAALVLFGLLMVYSASSYENVVKGFAAYKDVIKQGIFALAGLAVMIFIFSNVDYHRYTLQLTKYGVVVILILNVAVILFDPTKGASRWIKFGGISFQPSELAKFIVVLYAANMLKRMETYRRRPWKPVMKVFLVAGLFAGVIVLLQSNLSIGAIVLISAFVLIFLSGASLLHVGFLAALGFAGLLMALLLEPYRMARLMSFMKPFEDAQGDGHQLVQSLYALTGGGFFGRGLGMSRMKAFWLPEAHNDFIFAVVVEELGFLGGFILILLILLLIFSGIRIAMKAQDTFGRLLAMGITTVFALQSLINIAVVIGAFPVTGVTLPFISAGGTSLMVNLAAVGILLNISRQKAPAKTA